MLRLVGDVLVELDLLAPQARLTYCINITSGESLAISAFVSENRFFQVKASEFSDLHGQYDAYCRAREAFPAFVPRPLGYRARDGWSVMVTEGIRHSPVHAANFRRRRIGGATLMDHALAFFAAAAQRVQQPGPAPQHQALLRAVETHFASTPSAAVAAQCLRSARTLGVESLGCLAQHGDLVINNLADAEGRLIVFDWEDYDKVHLPGFDIFTLSMSLLAENAQAIRSMMDSTSHDPQFDKFLQRACALQGIADGLFRQLIPLYLLVFLYLKRRYGVAIRERIGVLLTQLAGSECAAPELHPQLESGCAG